jgi:hypothetical protein
MFDIGLQDVSGFGRFSIQEIVRSVLTVTTNIGIENNKYNSQCNVSQGNPPSETWVMVDKVAVGKVYRQVL